MSKFRESDYRVIESDGMHEFMGEMDKWLDSGYVTVGGLIFTNGTYR